MKKHHRVEWSNVADRQRAMNSVLAHYHRDPAYWMDRLHNARRKEDSRDEADCLIELRRLGYVVRCIKDRLISKK